MSGKALTSSISDGYSTPDHHVHFASNAAPVTSPTYEEHFSQWTSPRQHPLHTAEVGTHMTDSGCDDTRSTGSSHTSGIVTDFPMSPSHKQPSSFDCPHCSNVSSATHSLARDSDVLLSNLHLYSDDGFHTLPRYTCHEEANSLLGTKSTVSSTLCPSMRLSRASSIDNSCSTGDTVIDEPINVYRSKPQVSQMPVTKHSDDSKGRSRVRTFFKVKKQRGPDPPANLFAYLDSTGEDNMLVLEWTPVRYSYTINLYPISLHNMYYQLFILIILGQSFNFTNVYSLQPKFKRMQQWLLCSWLSYLSKRCIPTERRWSKDLPNEDTLSSVAAHQVRSQVRRTELML